MLEHPSAESEWNIERKITEIAAAGFQAVTGALDERSCTLAREAGLECIGWFWATDFKAISRGVAEQSALGITKVTTFLGRHDTTATEALELALALDETSRAVGIMCATETHRDTATETPEKTASLLAGFREQRGCEMPITWDFSHHAIVKHLDPSQFETRLFTERENIIGSRLFHLRPFNGHHAQVPIFHEGKITPEARDFLAFVRTIFQLWRQNPANENATLWACPEIGPKCSGYSLRHQLEPWAEACALRDLLEAAWVEASLTPANARDDNQQIRPRLPASE